MFGKKRGDMAVLPYSEKSDVRLSHVAVVPLRGIRHVEIGSLQNLVPLDVATIEKRLENGFGKQSEIAVGMVRGDSPFVQKAETRLRTGEFGDFSKLADENFVEIGKRGSAGKTDDHALVVVFAMAHERVTEAGIRRFGQGFPIGIVEGVHGGFS